MNVKISGPRTKAIKRVRRNLLIYAYLFSPFPYQLFKIVATVRRLSAPLPDTGHVNRGRRYRRNPYIKRNK